MHPEFRDPRRNQVTPVAYQCMGIPPDYNVFAHIIQ